VLHQPIEADAGSPNRNSLFSSHPTVENNDARHPGAVNDSRHFNPDADDF
jgi:hypothetical protein